jgi:hypothetical protein
MARNVFEEWQMFHSLENFRDWLDSGAPSEDAVETTPSSAMTAIRG